MVKYERLTRSDNSHRPYRDECFKCIGKECNRCDYDYEVWERLAELEDRIERGSLIELKKGKWLNSEKAFASFVCSECGGEPMYSPGKKGKAYITITQFCPSCGAKMDFTE